MMGARGGPAGSGCGFPALKLYSGRERADLVVEYIDAAGGFTAPTVLRQHLRVAEALGALSPSVKDWADPNPFVAVVAYRCDGESAEGTDVWHDC